MRVSENNKPAFGLTDEALSAMPTVYRSDLFAGRTVLVSGAGSGIGKAIAFLFARLGAKLAICGRDPEKLEQTAAWLRKLGSPDVFMQPMTIRDPEQVDALMDAVWAHFGGLDILVNNAGIFPRMPFLETTPEFWDQIFTINLRGAFLCAQAAVPPMRERGGGCILNIGSGGAFLSGDLLFAYGISKGALFVMTQNLARNLAKDRIRANFITVGWVLTEK